MINKHNQILLPFFFLFDLLVVFVAYNSAYLIRFLNEMPLLKHQYFYLLVLVLVLWSISSLFFQTYNERQAKSFKWHFNRFLLAQIVFLFGIFAYIILTKGHFVSRKFLVFFIVLQSLSLSIAHIVRRYFIISHRKKGRNYKQVIVLGDLSQNNELLEWSKNKPEYGYRIENSINYKNSDIDYSQLLRKEFREKKYDELLIASQSLQRNQIRSVIEVAEDYGLRVTLIPQFLRTLNTRITIDYLNGKPVINIRYEPLKYLHNRMLKRSFDIVFSALILVTFYWWLHIIIGILFKLFFKGPVIFKQRRIGINGNEFVCYKFRTMIQDKKAQNLAEHGFGEITSKKDSRVSWIGTILRRTYLDELPQFINVLKGNMSIIGPRPHMIQEDFEIRKTVPKYRIRQFIKPGITGWAAINGYRGGTKNLELMKKRVEHDIYYIENWTLFFDIKIILTTIFQILTFRKGKN